MAVRSWDELRLLRLARRVFTVVKKKQFIYIAALYFTTRATALGQLPDRPHTRPRDPSITTCFSKPAGLCGRTSTYVRAPVRARLRVRGLRLPGVEFII